MSGAWLVCRQPKPAARLRLLCVPYAGGGTSVFAGWASRLPDDVEVSAVRLPGRESRLLQRPYRSLDDLLPDLAEAVVDYCREPFMLFGHSMGALIAYELARWLRTDGSPGPEHLMVSARRAPHLAHNRPAIHDLPDDALVERLRHFGGVPEQLLANPAAMRLVIPVLRADVQLNDAYTFQPGPPLECPITAFGGQADTHVDHAGLAAWAELTRGEFALSTFPGGHFFIHSARAELLAHIGKVGR